MKKNKQIKKIIFSLIFLILFATSSTLSYAKVDLDWENPNKNGDNPFKLNTDAILNPTTMMQVIGCTGVVDKITTVTTNFLKKLAGKKIRAIMQTQTKKALEKICASTKSAMIGTAAGVPQATGVPMSTSIQNAIINAGACDPTKTVEDRLSLMEAQLAAEKEESNTKREECFNGLAYTLAKNQLTSMTRQTLNWVNSGFEGNPMYVQNITSLTNSISKNVVENGIMVLADGVFPYSDTFANTAIKNYRTGGLGNNSLNFLDDLSSDLSAFISDTKSYFNYPDTTTLNEIRRKREIEASRAFSNDFSVGGWDGWNALTQRDQNNPLGFTMMAAQKLADQIDYQTNVTKDELKENNGFLSQKECTLWQLYDKDGKPLSQETGKTLFAGVGGTSGIKETKIVTSEYKSNSGYDKCIDWRVTTPGSLIRDKVASYMGSPERQLEMADTINEGLNGLFTKLIEGFRSEGLFGLSQGGSSFDTSGNSGVGGYGVNDGGDYSSLFAGYENKYYDNTSGYDTNFDLTRDLGNTYIRDDVRSLGRWDAKNNKIWNPNTKSWTGGELYVDLGVYNEVSKGYEAPNYYYIVDIGGNTKLFNNGYNGWAVGDRAFWDGEKWQNWKKDQLSPIKTRGIVQVQSDYIVAATSILKILPSIMPKLGELDYCIPGPNLNWRLNSLEVGSLFEDYAATLGGSYQEGSFFKRNSTKYTIAQKGDLAYDNYAKLFAGNDTYFNQIKQTNTWKLLDGKANVELKNNTKEDAMMKDIGDLQTSIAKEINSFFSLYGTRIFDAFYKEMQSEYLFTEDNYNPVKNTAYVPMISDGYNMTKDMVETSEDIQGAIEDYTSSIIQAQQNVSKLNVIKSEVSSIIKAAQERRKAIILEKYKPLTEAQYKQKYADCLEEENISYYDERDIMNNIEANESSIVRCTDGLDNDLDGKADGVDPDCKAYIN